MSSDPKLTPKVCFNETALRDFLRLSRATVDDTIYQNLNALITPSSPPFDPHSVSTRTPASPNARRIPRSICQNFIQTVLYPSWHSRSKLLTYCATVAASPDPSDPEALLRRIQDQAARQRVVDERLDPYSGRYLPLETKAERLAGVVRNELGVERIVRQRTWAAIRERCADSNNEDEWEKNFDMWRRKRERDMSEVADDAR